MSASNNSDLDVMLTMTSATRPGSRTSFVAWEEAVIGTVSRSLWMRSVPPFHLELVLIIFTSLESLQSCYRELLSFA